MKTQCRVQRGDYIILCELLDEGRQARRVTKTTEVWTSIFKSTNHQAMKKQWPHILSIVCVDVYPGNRDILLVSRQGGDWSFLCGSTHPESLDQFHAIGMSHLLERDPTLHQVLNLGRDQSAERHAPGGRWWRVPTSQLT